MPGLLRRSAYALVVVAIACTAPSSRAQTLQLSDDATLDLSGGIQPRAGLGVEGADDTERLGLGLRRARLQFRLTLLEKAGMEYDIDTTPGDLRSVDLFAFYDITETVQVRAGRLPPAQPRGFVPTSYSRIDAVDRAAVVERWAAGTLGSSGRDIGADVTVELGRTRLQATLHNGTGGFSRETDNFRESGSGGSLTRGTDATALALSAGVHHGEPSGLAGGGFVSVNARGSERTALDDRARAYGSAGTHLYWGERPGSQPVRVKLDAVATQYESVDGLRQRSTGGSLLGAVRILEHGELFARVETYRDDLDTRGDTFGTLGASYSPSAALGRDYRDLRVSVAYTVRETSAGDIGHLGVLQGQIIF